jgi:hypothetical protein
VITLAFYKGVGDYRDWVVRKATRSIYSHVELVTTPDTQTVPSLCISASKRDGNRVRSKVIDFREHPDHWDFLVVDHPRREVIERVREHEGRPYDAIGAVLTVTPIVTSRPGKWFCSELIGYALGLPQPHTLTPGKLYERLKNDA